MGGSSGAGGVWNSVQENPDAYMRMLAALAPRGYRAPMSAMGGALEQYKYNDRMAGASAQPQQPPQGMGDTETSAVTRPTSKQPRSRTAALESSLGQTSQYAKEDRASAEKDRAVRRSRIVPPALGSVSRPSSPTQKSFTSAQAQPSLEQIARLLVSRQGRFGPQPQQQTQGVK
jgi:hypothetical protein